MDEWIDYYDLTHTIYASKLHRDLHFQVIARDIIGYISSPDQVVLDYACGEALSAAKVAEACSKLFLAEPAPGVRGLADRAICAEHQDPRSLDDLRRLEERSIDLVVMNSVAQYMTPEELDSAFAVIRRLLKPAGRLVLGDILLLGRHGERRAGAVEIEPPHGFLKDALDGLARRPCRTTGSCGTRVGLQRYSEDEMIRKLAAEGFSASRARSNYRAQSMADDVPRAARPCARGAAERLRSNG